MVSQDRFDYARLILRILVGWVFLSEGIQKFLFPAALGVGRFAKIGIPHPEIMAPFVGGVEILFGLLVILGVYVMYTAVPLLIVICTAIATTKIPMLAKQGGWATLHEARTDVSMLLGLIAVMLLGAGRFALMRRADG